MATRSADIPQLVETVSGMMSISESSSIGSYSNRTVYDGKSSFTKGRQPSFQHQSSSFIRVCDLDISSHSDSIVLADPPKADCEGTKNQWIGLDVAEKKNPKQQQSHQISPCAPKVLELLVKNGLQAIADDSLWVPDSATEAILKERKRTGGQRINKAHGTSSDTTVLIWTGSFRHQGYGNDIPAVRSQGIVGMSAHKLMSLIADSSRVTEYNKNSTGRRDLQVFRNDLFSSGADQNAAITKVMLSTAQPPLVRLVLEFLTLLHARKLTPQDGCGEGYVAVCRAVDKTCKDFKEPKQTGGMFGPTVVRSEILLNVHLITVIPGFEDSKCEMTNINHLKSSMVPSFIAKKLGLSAAVNFLNDIRALC